jgi:DMSO/TMAO reductase YedYZ molybdopterin-dependent catalytic subunit
MTFKKRTVNNNEPTLSRRTFIGATMLAGGSLLVDLKALADLSTPDPISKPYANGRLLKVLPFVGEMPISPGELIQTGLDGRLYTDLSSLSPESLTVPTDKFYVRTGCPDLIDYSKPWQIKVTSPGGDVRWLPVEKINSMSKDMDTHLMECSGNERGGQFGLMSACSWEGVPVMHLLKSMKLSAPKSQRICISGFDHYSKPSGTPGLRQSIPGASWIFTPQQLQSTGAFLATKMNGAPLSKDHGFPVRLMVPGWYGCTCIKWVDEIFFVDEDAVATSQMKEFAGRTHQDGVPDLARQYKPASIDQAAMPIRVEQWLVDGHIEYNVVGIMWGGDRLTESLQICFVPDGSCAPVETYHQATNATWTLWSYKWKPEVTGTYRIQLKIADPAISTKRLDKGYYARAVQIQEL